MNSNIETNMVSIPFKSLETPEITIYMNLDLNDSFIEANLKIRHNIGQHFWDNNVNVNSNNVNRNNYNDPSNLVHIQIFDENMDSIMSEYNQDNLKLKDFCISKQFPAFYFK